jgi:acyl-coenzyme A synthetase/AMP-(fatty) acid ligase
MYTGATAFPISTGNSPAAIAHLLRSTGSNYIFVNDNPTLQSLVVQAIEILAGSNFRVQILSTPTFSSFYNDEPFGSQLTVDSIRLWPVMSDDTLLILHSSGTSSFPKPIMQNSGHCISSGLLSCPYSLNLLLVKISNRLK